MPPEAGKPAAVCSGGGEEYGMLLPHPPVPTLPHGQVPPLGQFKWWQVGGGSSGSSLSGTSRAAGVCVCTEVHVGAHGNLVTAGPKLWRELTLSTGVKLAGKWAVSENLRV